MCLSFQVLEPCVSIRTGETPVPLPVCPPIFPCKKLRRPAIISPVKSAQKPVGGEEFIPTRLSLLSRLKRWDHQESWRDFFDTYWKFLYSVAIKAGLSDEDARDVVQETVVAVAKGLREGRFKAAAGSSFKLASAHSPSACRGSSPQTPAAVGGTPRRR